MTYIHFNIIWPHWYPSLATMSLHNLHSECFPTLHATNPKIHEYCVCSAVSPGVPAFCCCYEWRKENCAVQWLVGFHFAHDMFRAHGTPWWSDFSFPIGIHCKPMLRLDDMQVILHYGRQETRVNFGKLVVYYYEKVQIWPHMHRDN